MPIPAPEPGLVISYTYLWDREAQDGREEGRKTRPCVIALAIERQPDDETLVTVLPITHQQSDNPAVAAEIPLAVKRHLGLDDARSWVIVSEGDQFVWPGYDLRKAPGSERYDFGFLPPRLFQQILDAFRAWHRSNKGTLVVRD